MRAIVLSVSMVENCLSRKKQEGSMALIENLEREGWEEFLRNCFRQTLDLLQDDRYRFAGSSVDDLKSWLTAGKAS